MISLSCLRFSLGTEKQRYSLGIFLDEIHHRFTGLLINGRMQVEVRKGDVCCKITQG